MELPWIRFLVGELAADIIEDPEHTIVPPFSLIVSAKPSAFGSETLAKVRRTGTVGLVHVGDVEYKARLETYKAFGFVWRTYFYSALVGTDIRQIPLGPSVRDVVTQEPLPEAGKPPPARRHTWSYDGGTGGTVPAMLEAFRGIDGGLIASPPGGEPNGEDVRRTGMTDAGMLADSVFAPCPMEGKHLESSRIYNALELGAIPVVERRRRLDYLGLLLGNHPLPTVATWDQAPTLLWPLLNDPRALVERQQQVVAWWAATKEALAKAAQNDVRACFAGAAVTTSDVPLDRPPPRWRGRMESLRHKSPYRQWRQKRP